MDVKMKKSSMNTAPNGKIPPVKMLTAPLMYHGCSGICLGILFVRTGSSAISFFVANHAPAYTNGIEIPNHKNTRMKNVPNGMAPLDFCVQMKKFRNVKTPNNTPGNIIAANPAFPFQSGPLKIL